jgi:hypothetical protein
MPDVDCGERPWKERRGSKNVSSEGCDLGKGAVDRINDRVAYVISSSSPVNR